MKTPIEKIMKIYSDKHPADKHIECYIANNGRGWKSFLANFRLIENSISDNKTFEEECIDRINRGEDMIETKSGVKGIIILSFQHKGK